MTKNNILILALMLGASALEVKLVKTTQLTPGATVDEKDLKQGVVEAGVEGVQWEMLAAEAQGDMMTIAGRYVSVDAYCGDEDDDSVITDENAQNWFCGIQSDGKKAPEFTCVEDWYYDWDDGYMSFSVPNAPTKSIVYAHTLTTCSESDMCLRMFEPATFKKHKNDCIIPYADSTDELPPDATVEALHVDLEQCQLSFVVLGDTNLQLYETVKGKLEKGQTYEFGELISKAYSLAVDPYFTDDRVDATGRVYVGGLTLPYEDSSTRRATEADPSQVGATKYDHGVIGVDYSYDNGIALGALGAPQQINICRNEDDGGDKGPMNLMLAGPPGEAATSIVLESPYYYGYTNSVWTDAEVTCIKKRRAFLGTGAQTTWDSSLNKIWSVDQHDLMLTDPADADGSSTLIPLDVFTKGLPGVDEIKGKQKLDTAPLIHYTGNGELQVIYQYGVLKGNTCKHNSYHFFTYLLTLSYDATDKHLGDVDGRTLSCQFKDANKWDESVGGDLSCVYDATDEPLNNPDATELGPADPEGRVDATDLHAADFSTHGLDEDVVAVKVPTLVAVVFMSGFALGGIALELLKRYKEKMARGTEAEPLLKLPSSMA